MPQRITDSLIDVLKKHHPIWINTHFNHPKEFTQESKYALEKLANAGIPLGNQSVLLARVNDCPKDGFGFALSGQGHRKVVQLRNNFV